MDEYPSFPRITRFYRDWIVTEKVDGTNGLVSARFDHYARYVGEGASMQQDADCEIPKPEPPRRWSSPDGSVVYEEVERFEDADYAGVFGGEVLRTRMMGDESAWYIQTVMGGSFTDKWVRRVLGGER